MNNSPADEKDVKKIIPSRLERWVQQFLSRHLGKHIPASMTPNQITWIGAGGSLLGIICAACTRFSPLFLFGVMAGLVIHLVADDLDGYVARTRNMTSKAGAYLDLILDILHITYLIIALALAGWVDIKIALFLTPVYALIIVTCQNYIQYFQEFLFPRLGPIETHLFFLALCIAGLIFGKEPLISLGGIGLRAADLIVIGGGILMYYEMIRMQIELYKRLKQSDEERE